LAQKRALRPKHTYRTASSGRQHRHQQTPSKSQKKPDEACVSHGDQNRRFKTLGQSENARKSRGNFLISGCPFVQKLISGRPFVQKTRSQEGVRALNRKFFWASFF